MARPHRVEKCPNCVHKTLHINYEVRKNYPFGKGSKPRYFKKKKEEICRHVKTDKDGVIVFRCGYYRVYTSPPLLSVDNPYE